MFRSKLWMTGLLIGGTLVLGACDEDGVLEIEEEVFAAELTALNGSGVTGTATFVADEDGAFTARVQAIGLAPGEVHPQHVHAGASCPTLALDDDGDGLIGVAEGGPAYGLILIPLDGDLADAGQNLSSFPTGTPIDYEQSVGLDALLAAISGPDPDPDDMLTKLDGEALALGTRSVVLHGAFVLDGEVVPAGTAGAEYQATLPVACGTVVQTS